MSQFRDSPAMKKAGVNRASHLAYSVESYIIRTQIVYDRALRLVDRFFYLGNVDSELRHSAIVSNVHVSDTGVPVALKHLRKHLGKFTELRHEIVHRGSFQDDELNTLEMIAILNQSEPHEEKFEHIPEMLRERTQEFLRSRKRTYRRFNSKAYELIWALFDALEKQRTNVESRVARATNHSD